MTHTMTRTLAAGMMAGALASPAILHTGLEARQTSTSVFPVYEGFLKNDDGTLLLAFAYFNHNRVCLRSTTTAPPSRSRRARTTDS